MPGYYDIQQVCLNGHQITDQFNQAPIHRKEHCPECGAATIWKCPQCQTPIQGQYDINSPGVVFVPPPAAVPNYCHKCGAPYPWTVKAIEDAKSLVEESGLSDEEEQRAKQDIEDIAHGRRVKAAIEGLKRISKKTGGWLWAEVKQILVEVVSETTKKIITG